MTSKKSNLIYTKITESYRINIPFNKLSKNIFELLESILKNKLEKKCDKNGYVKSDSVKVISYTTGELNGANIYFTIIYQCYVANPVESMIIECKVSSVTKVGIRAILNQSDNENSPFIVFIARDHHYNNKDFSKLKETDVISVKVLGKRYELYDENISIIGELVV